MPAIIQCIDAPHEIWEPHFSNCNDEKGEGSVSPRSTCQNCKESCHHEITGELTIHKSRGLDSPRKLRIHAKRKEINLSIPEHVIYDNHLKRKKLLCGDIETSKRILLTGGAGFIGSHVLIHLVKRYPHYTIINLDCLDYCSCIENVDDAIGNAKNYKFIKGNIVSEDLVDRIIKTERIDTIMHFAALTHVDNSFGNSLAFTKNNVLGTHVLLEAAKQNNIKLFVHVSTDEVYGEGKADTPEMKECHVLEPTNPYAATKAGAEYLVKSYQRSFNLPTIITRSNNIYGPHQYPEKLVPKAINQILRSTKVTLHGSGENTRNYVHVQDVARAFDIILHKGVVGEVYNIGGSNEVRNLHVTKDLLALMKPGCRFEDHVEFVEDRPFNDLRYAIDASKLKVLGWKEEIQWLEGLKETIDWYKKYGSRYRDLDLALQAHPRRYTCNSIKN